MMVVVVIMVVGLIQKNGKEVGSCTIQPPNGQTNGYANPPILAHFFTLHTSVHDTLPLCSSPLFPPMPCTSRSISSSVCPPPAPPAAPPP